VTPLMERALIELAGRVDPAVRGVVAFSLGLKSRALVTPFCKLEDERLIERTGDSDHWRITEKGLAYAVHGIADTPAGIVARYRALVDAREAVVPPVRDARQVAADARLADLIAAAARDGDLTETDLAGVMVGLPMSRLGTMAEYITRMVIELRRRREAVATQAPAAYQVVGVAGNELLTTSSADTAAARVRDAGQGATVRPLYTAASIGPDDSPLMEELRQHRERVEDARLGAIATGTPEGVGPAEPWDQAELEAFAEEVTLLDGVQMAMFNGSAVASLACEVLRSRRALSDPALQPPWLPDLLAMFGWQGGTYSQALAEVRRLRAFELAAPKGS
jgi:hypothetical protein